MQRKRVELVPIGEVVGGLAGPESSNYRCDNSVSHEMRMLICHRSPLSLRNPIRLAE